MTVGSAGGAAASKGSKRLGVTVLIGAVTATVVLVPAAVWAAPPSTPVITSPSEGDSISAATVEVEATSGATEVRFLLETPGPQFEATAATSAGAASVEFSTVGLGGPITLWAFDCDAPGDCNPAGASINVTLSLTAPTLTAPVNGAVVGDNFTARAVSNLGPVGFVVDGGLVTIDSTAPYVSDVDISGKGDGHHTVRAVQCDLTGATCLGAESSPLNITKDTRGPTWRSVKASPKRFYPVKDHYLDTTRLNARMSEDAASVKVGIFTKGGGLVRTLSLGHKGQGLISVVWNGRKNNGDLVAPGNYDFRFFAKDNLGNASESPKGSVAVSDKRLVKQTQSQTVSAVQSFIGNASGSCGGVYRLNYPQARFDWPKGAGYYSRSRCNGSGADDLAAGVHRMRVKHAIRYGSVSVDTYGAGAFRHSGPGAELYVTSSGDIGASRKISPNLGWHTGPSVSLDKYLHRGRVTWVFATINGDWYDVKEFRITYSYFVLR